VAIAISAAWVPGQAFAAFQLKEPSHPEPVKVKGSEVANPRPAFDSDQYEVWVDRAYSAVVEYGRPGDLVTAPSYGDPMPLQDALSLLVPNKWVVLRSKDVSDLANTRVTWEMESATWVSVLKNLGERHGLRFHVDHTNREIFVQRGRKLLEERAVAAEVKNQVPKKKPANKEELKSDSVDKTVVKGKNGDVWEADNDVLATPGKVNERAPKNASFIVRKGDTMREVLADMAMLFGYEKTYWMMATKTAEEDRHYEGEPVEVLHAVTADINGKLCLYEGNKVAAFISQSMECPK